MADTISPNPYSPYATAEAGLRHSIPSFLGLLPDPGVLCLATCERMTVAPDEGVNRDVLNDIAAGTLPDGMCPACIAVATGQAEPDRIARDRCTECGGASSQGQWCALCRQELHEAWWPNRPPVDMPLADLPDLTWHATKPLEKADPPIVTYADFTTRTDEQLLQIAGFSHGRLDKVRAAIAATTRTPRVTLNGASG
ncbi:hypothetical protein ACFWYW_46860 [Nonomuraea sp. NPDC059023]|uniref:hypothetical protein n=1 Tax=unclassified Nonomuraea TaxID=2593643 RepID=UPI00367A9FD8